ASAASRSRSGSPRPAAPAWDHSPCRPYPDSRRKVRRSGRTWDYGGGCAGARHHRRSSTRGPMFQHVLGHVRRALAGAAVPGVWPALAAGKFLNLREAGGAQARLGAAVAVIGDVNHDGFDDILVGAPNATFGSAAECGRMGVFSGKTGDVIF